MIKKEIKNDTRKVRQQRVRNKVSGTPERPRLNVFRSLKHVYAQIIDDATGTTLVSASSMEKALKEINGGNVEGAKEIGALVAKRALEKGIKQVVFDRAGYIYHGRVKQIAESAREAGLEF